MFNDNRRKKNPCAKFDETVLQLGDAISKILLPLPDSLKNDAYEIRLRCGQPVTLTLPSGTYIPEMNHLLSCSQMNTIFAKVCGNAVYAHQTEIADGCITLVGGHRVGICGRAVRTDSGIQTYKDISSLCIRIAHEVIGCADEIADYFKVNKGGVLIAGPPCSGKTTILRDIARQLSGEHNIAIIDERNEIAAVHRGMPQLDIGLCADVLTGHEKAPGMLHAVRCMSPNIIICDEIGSPAEAQAVKAAFNSGVSVIAALHCGSISELSRREQFIHLRSSGAFRTAAILSESTPGKISCIMDINEI